MNPKKQEGTTEGAEAKGEFDADDEVKEATEVSTPSVKTKPANPAPSETSRMLTESKELVEGLGEFIRMATPEQVKYVSKLLKAKDVKMDALRKEIEEAVQEILETREMILSVMIDYGLSNIEAERIFESEKSFELALKDVLEKENAEKDKRIQGLEQERTDLTIAHNTIKLEAEREHGVIVKLEQERDKLKADYKAMMGLLSPQGNIVSCTFEKNGNCAFVNELKKERERMLSGERIWKLITTHVSILTKNPADYERIKKKDIEDARKILTEGD